MADTEPTTEASRLILENLGRLIDYCRREMLAHPSLRDVVARLHVADSDEWLKEALSLFRLCMKEYGPAVEWHDEVGELNFAVGLSIGDANRVLAILRDGILELVFDRCTRDELGKDAAPSVVAAVLAAFDRALAAQASAYVRESQRHLSEINRRLEYRQGVFERDLALATLVQQQFLPKEFESENFRAHVRYIPTAGVGGDHAGIFPVSPDRVYVSICDVTGHGIASALVAEVVSSHLRSVLRRPVDTAFEPTLEPVDIVKELNTLVNNEFEPLGILLTFFLALVDTGREAITYSGAGHPPPILQCCAKHNFVELRSQNIILGAAEDCIIGEGQDTIPIHRGDRIIFYTDGIIEANDENGNILGLDGLSSIVEEHYETPQKPLADEIINAARKLTQNTESDDMSLILLDVLRKPEA